MKIYIGNLPFSLTNDKLKELFAKFGEVSEATIISDKFTNRSKGFGFVTIENDEAAKKAIKELNEKDIEGRKITVNEAKPREENSSGPRRNFGNRDRNNNRRRF